MMEDRNRYLWPSISNGRPEEQALIRKWWYETHGAQGRIVWEYHFEGFYADAIWFPDVSGYKNEEPGKGTGALFPVAGARIILCEAKSSLTPELVGQALVYSEFARRAGANLAETIVFSESGTPQMQKVARSLGLSVVVDRQANALSKPGQSPF